MSDNLMSSARVRIHDCKSAGYCVVYMTHVAALVDGVNMLRSSLYVCGLRTCEHEQNCIKPRLFQDFALHNLTLSTIIEMKAAFLFV